MVTRVTECHRFDKSSIIADEINKRYPGANVSKNVYSRLFDVKDVCTCMTFVAMRQETEPFDSLEN